MRSANLFGPLKGLCPHKALIGLTQASGLAGGFDLNSFACLKPRDMETDIALVSAACEAGLPITAAADGRCPQTAAGRQSR